MYKPHDFNACIFEDNRGELGNNVADQFSGVFLVEKILDYKIFTLLPDKFHEVIFIIIKG